MPKVSVIISTYNQTEYLPKAIDSVLSQTFQDYEIIVVNDGSTDITAEVMDGYSSRYPDKIRYFYQKNSGASAARNYGISQIRGDFVKFLDSDDFIYPRQLEMQIENLLKENADISITNYERIYPDGSRVEIKLRKPVFGLIDLIEGKFGPIHSFLVKKDILIKVGGFDKNLRIKEDDDLWLRLLIAGAKVAIEKSIGCCYCIHEGSLSSNNEGMFTSNCYVSEKMNWLLKDALGNLSEELLSCLLWRNQIMLHKCFARGYKAKKVLPITLEVSCCILKSQKSGLKKIFLSLCKSRNYFYLQYWLHSLRRKNYRRHLTLNSETSWRLSKNNA